MVTAPGTAPAVGDSVLATFLRFVAVGATGSAAYGLLFLAISATTTVPHLAVNLLATVGSTLLSSELHRRFTFRAHGPGSVSHGQTAGIGMAAVGLVVSSLVLAGWNIVNPGAEDLTTLFVVYGCTGLMGLVNFVTQRTVLARTVSPRATLGTEMPEWLGGADSRPAV
ncbi:hypothetical protein GCM10009818_20180 [Nakamurella flavida]